MTASITRRYRFSASHRLNSSELSDEKNREIFGKCNNPYGHGHNYELEVTVRGVVEPATGLIVSIQALDDYVQSRVLERFSNRYMNLDLIEFAQLVPTTENMASVIAGILSHQWEAAFGKRGPALARIQLQETARNGFELLLKAKAGTSPETSERAKIYA
jgi:6-pyruvoyltetrahydropterin/6-carboxytetrahydropterin synthase